MTAWPVANPILLCSCKLDLGSISAVQEERLPQNASHLVKPVDRVFVSGVRKALCLDLEIAKLATAAQVRKVTQILLDYL